MDSQKVRFNNQDRTQRTGYVVVPYVKGTSESFKNTLQKYGINVYFKGGTTIKSTLMKPKDQDQKMKKSGVIYRVRCDSCSDNYVGESGRVFEDRFKEHLKAPSPIYLHHSKSGHPLPSENNVDILAREGHSFSRQIKESMFIRTNNPSMNRNIGKYELPRVYDVLLEDCIDLKFK